MEIWHKGDLNDPNVADQEGAIKEYLDLLLHVCAKDTSADPNDWTVENPLYGHCAVVALLVQENFGGKILRASLLEVGGYEQMQSHYWNLMKNGSEVDLTAGQFKDGVRDQIPAGKTTKMDSRTRKEIRITRTSLLAYEPTRKRYELLKKRVEEEYSERTRKTMNS